MTNKAILAATLMTTTLFSATTFAAAPITAEDVKKAQAEWAEAIVAIGKTKGNGETSQKTARDVIERLYAYSEGNVLFKPTKAMEDQFRETEREALSYFVGGSIKEDKGFALQPWSKVRFADDAQVFIDGDSAISMGNYYFTDADSGKEVKVEFTFGYKRAENDRLVIFLHHSSLPYQAH
ncbi:MAG TPA: hypothetical protein ENO14_02805 [Chromatiales bacterium]|nr:hypothetical protein [Chromatiales bacterium]